MGLDIYVGPLTRYYTTDWETIVQQVMKANGQQVNIVRPAGFVAPTAEQSRAAVLAWRTALGGPLGATLAWDETADGEYSTYKPDWDGYHALRYLALHDEFPDVRPPARLASKPDPAQLAREPLEQRFGEVYSGKQRQGLGRLFGRKAEPHEPRYLHLQAPTMWLPADFPKPIRTQGPLGDDAVIGSVPRLRAELEGLNGRTINAETPTLEHLRDRGQPDDGNFEGLARFGLAVMLLLVRDADTRSQPMILDS